MIGNIYYKTQRKSYELFQKIFESYKQAGLVTNNPLDIKYSRYNCEGHFANGDIWRTIRIGDSTRGYRWDTAYIDNDINTDDIFRYIAPYCLHNPWIHHTMYY
jgi:hypothetical protein